MTQHSGNTSGVVTERKAILYELWLIMLESATKDLSVNQFITEIQNG
jgi:hypothetical protein